MSLEPTAAKKKRLASRKLTLWLGGAAGVAVLAAIIGSFAVKHKPGEHERAGRRAQEPLPYVAYAPIRPEHRGKVGTTLYKQEQSWRGYNLYIQKPEAAAILIDMQGEVVHRWASTEGQPEHVLHDWTGWFTVRMTPNGDLYASIDKHALIKLDWDSKLLWKLDIAPHHEIFLADNGDAYVVTAQVKVAEVAGVQRLLEDDVIAVVSPDGKVGQSISFYDLFARNPDVKTILDKTGVRLFAKLDQQGLEALVKKKDAGKIEDLKTLTATGKLEGSTLYEQLALLRIIPGIPGDIFHVNAVVVLKDHPRGLWKAGDIMASFRYMNLVLVFDPVEKHVKWFYGPGQVYGQHNPTVLPNGNLLIYDNGTWRPGTGGRHGKKGGEAKYTRLVEVDPVSKTIVWSYEADPREGFYSPGSGTAQMLPNGNILVGEEDGRAFEITHEKEMVWEYFNPKFDKTGKLRSGMYRIERLAPSVVEPLLARPHP